MKDFVLTLYSFEYNGNGNNKEDVSELSESEEEIDVLTDESSGESDSEILKTKEKKKPPVITDASMNLLVRVTVKS